MTLPDPKTERLSEFERAVCYDTLPQVTRPLTPRVIFAYTFALILTFAAMAYGVRTDIAAWTTWGRAAFAAVVIGGMIGFLYRALLNAVRQRAALVQAEVMPDVASGFDELPDPFAGHALLRYYRVANTNSKTITGNRGETFYTVQRTGAHDWEVRDPAGELVLTVNASRSPRSFSFDWGMPSQFRVTRNGQPVAEIERLFTLGPGRIEIRNLKNGDVTLFTDGGLFDNDALIGRVYDIRNYLYLDVRQSRLDDAILAFYVAMLG
jgi:hypothetical protein